MMDSTLDRLDFVIVLSSLFRHVTVLGYYVLAGNSLTGTLNSEKGQTRFVSKLK
jgi:hypothetical protein